MTSTLVVCHPMVFITDCVAVSKDNKNQSYVVTEMFTAISGMYKRLLANLVVV